MSEYCAMVPTKVFTREATGLVREFGALESFLVCFSSWSLPVSIIGANAAVAQSFPGADLNVVMLLALGPYLAMCITYLFLSIAMPRSGGDFVWNCVCLDPSIAFMISFAGLFFCVCLGNGLYSSWLPDYVVSGGLATIGLLTANPQLTQLGTLLATPNYTLAFGVLMQLSVMVVVLLGYRFVKTIMKLCIIPLLVIMVMVLGTLAISTHAQFVANFNTLDAAFTHSPDSVQVITNLYMNMGGTFPKASLVAALPAIAVGFWTLNGSNASVWIGGEMKNPKRSQALGILGSVALSFGFMVVFMLLYYNVVGWDLGNVIQFASTSPNYPISVPPTTTYLLGLLLINPWLDLLLLIAMVLGIWLMFLTATLFVSRTLFSYAFSSILPSKFADVSDRYHSPWVATITYICVVMIMQAISLYTTALTIFGTFTSLLTLNMFVASVSGIVFPFRRKDIFETAPKPVSSKIAGIPLLSIVALLSAVSVAYVFYQAASPGTILQDSVIVGGLIVSLLIFYVAKFYRRRQGIDLSLISRSLPPE